MTAIMKFSRRGFILTSLALAACKNGTDTLMFSGSAMGTNYSIVALNKGSSFDKATLQQAIDQSLLTVNTQLSNWDEASEVSRFNASASSAPMTVSPELAEVINAAKAVNLASDGQFDITLGPVIEAWGFGVNGAAQINEPNSDVLAAALNASGQTNGLIVDGNQISKTHPDTRIYLSSIGKGFGVDQLARTLTSFGINDFMVEIGGDLYVSGLNPEGQHWQIGIESPDALSRKAHQIASISNMGMATSGDYRNYFEQDGIRYSHIIDARTGRPITHNTASVTVLAENAMLADAWATALLVLGTKRGLEIANDRDMAVLFIDRDQNSGLATTTSKKFIALQA